MRTKQNVYKKNRGQVKKTVARLVVEKRTGDNYHTEFLRTVSKNLLKAVMVDQVEGHSCFECVKEEFLLWKILIVTIRIVLWLKQYKTRKETWILHVSSWWNIILWYFPTGCRLRKRETRFRTNECSSAREWKVFTSSYRELQTFKNPLNEDVKNQKFPILH